jgi:hypothetical protein
MVEEDKATKEGLWTIVSNMLTQSEINIIEVFLEEENTGKRHWELDPNDTNIYLEYLHGTNRLRNMVYGRVKSKDDKGGARIPTMKEIQEFQNGNQNIHRPVVPRPVRKRI